VDRVAILAWVALSRRSPLFESLRSQYHNEMSAESRLGVPRVYFEGNNFDNDASKTVELFRTTCVDPSCGPNAGAP